MNIDTLILPMQKFCGQTVLMQKSIFSSQKQVIRALFKVSVGSHFKYIIIDSKVMSLPCICIFQCLLFVKKNPIKFQLNADIHHYNTRHRRNLYKFHYYSRSLKSSFCTSIRLLNQLPTSIRDLKLSKFKVIVKQCLASTCFYFLEEYFNHYIMYYMYVY